jgi:gas vesicle protein
MFEDNNDGTPRCNFPGLRNPESYDAEARRALSEPEPLKPLKPTPYPTFTPVPQPTPYPSPTPPPQPGLFGDMSAYQRQREKQGQEYQQLREKQGQEYQQAREKQGQEYQKLVEKQMQEFEDRAGGEYQDKLRAWENKRRTAISTAEENIKVIYKNFGQAFGGTPVERWVPMTVIMFVVLALVMIFQKRKDVV